MKIQNGLGVKVVIGFTILHKLYVGGSNVSKSLHNVHVEVFDSHASRPMNRERVVPDVIYIFILRPLQTSGICLQHSVHQSLNLMSICSAILYQNTNASDLHRSINLL